MARKKVSDAQLKKNATDRLMNTVAWYAGYYRANPQRFCKDVLNLNLKLFQKIQLQILFILLQIFLMMKNNISYQIHQKKKLLFLILEFQVLKLMTQHLLQLRVI